MTDTRPVILGKCVKCGTYRVLVRVTMLCFECEVPK